MYFNYSKTKLILFFLFVLSIDLHAQREVIGHQGKLKKYKVKIL